ITAFHAELFHTREDRIVLGEVASRVAGPMVPEQFRVAFDVDLRRLFIRGQAGCPLELPTPPETPHRVGGELVVPVRSGVLTRAPSTCPLPGVVDYRLCGVAGQRYAAPRDINDFIATFVFAAASEAAMRDTIEEARHWFDRETAWEPEP